MSGNGGTTSTNDPAQLLLNFLQSPFSDQVQANSIWVALGYSVGVTAFVTILFSLIRPRHVVVYAPKIKYADKKHTPPAMGRGILSWIKPVQATREEALIEKLGMDAALFLRFIRMLRNMFLVLAVLGCGVLIPVHITQTNLIVSAGTNPNLNANSTYILAMTPQGVGAPAMWSHVVIAYMFNFVVLGFVWWNYRAVARIKKIYFQSAEYQHSLHARSLWMYDIPKSDRTDEGILRIADSVEHTAGIPRAAIARNVKELPEMIEEHTQTVKKLESVLAKYLKNPDKLPAQRPMLRASKRDHRADHSNKLDAIDYLTRRIQELEIEIKDTRESIDRRNAMGYGFATYDGIEEAHTVAYAARRKKPQGVTIRLAPKPNDFIWKNLSLTKQSRSSKRFVANLWVALLTVIWIAPNAMIAIFLVNLSHLGAIWPAFQDTLNSDTAFWGAVQAILGPTLLSSFYLVLPIIFRRLSQRAGDLTKTSREKHVTHKLYAFFVFNNLVVFSVFGSIWAFVSAVLKATNPGPGQQAVDAWTAIQEANFGRTLLTALCTVSAFWVTWLLQRNLGAAIDIAQLYQLWWVWFARTFMSPTPRQNIEWTAPQPFDYSSYFNYFLFYTTVALSNATLQPIVLPCALLIFVIEAFLKKYLLLYVYITKTESGGQFWNVLMNRILFGLAFSHFVEALVIKGAQGPDPWTTYIQLFCMVPLAAIIGGFKWYSVRNFEPRCKYYTKAVPSSGLAEADGSGNTIKRKKERIGVKFGHPALYKPLITPMVHAKAQHMLHHIYSGRVDGMDGGGADIALDPMHQTERGVKARGAGGAADMFEVVPESNLDFAYFKHRAEFGDEFGGGGELYGRAADVLSERSGTPASFLTQDSDDTRSFRDSSVPPSMPQHPAFRQAGPGAHSRQGSYGQPGYGQHGYGSQRGSPMGRPSPPAAGTPYGDPPGFYAQANDSHNSLLAGAAPGGYAPVTRHVSDFHGSEGGVTPRAEAYNLDRWRTGGSGYVGVATHDEDLGYDSYRQHVRQGSGPGSNAPRYQPPPGGYQPPPGGQQGYGGGSGF